MNAADDTADSAIVTGAGSGIGRAIALGFAQRGVKVVAADLNLAAAEETARNDSTPLVAMAVDIVDRCP